MRQILNSLCAYDRCRVLLPWFVWAHRQDPASRLRRHILTLDPLAPRAPVGCLRMTTAAALHLTRIGRQVLLFWHRQSRAARQGYGISRTRQLAQLFIAALRYNFPPSLYYHARLFRLERSRWPAVFSHAETTVLLVKFEQASMHLGLWSKSGWASFGTAHGIATPPLAARAASGEITVLSDEGLAAGRDFFLKPDRDYSGRGGVLLEWDPARTGWQACGASTAFVAADTLPEFLRAHSATGTQVVQPRLRNAPDLADLASRALVNFRILTLCSADGAVTVLMAALRLPPGDQPTSDVVGSTLCIPVNIETGVLGPAECARLELGALARHPQSGAPLEGRLISQWNEMKAQAVAAHTLLPGLPAIGWDLVATDRGVFILEANGVWNGNLAQHWGLTPLGETAWPALMLARLDAANAPIDPTCPVSPTSSAPN